MTAAPANMQVLTFFVGDAQFAARASDVSEVFRRPRITRVPNSPPSLLGVAGLRGAAAPVISLARLLGSEDQPSDDARVMLLAGGQAVGVAVDRIGTLASLPQPDGAPDKPDGLRRLYRVQDSALRVLDLESLIDQQFSWPAVPRRAAAAGQDAAEADGEVLALLGFELDGQAYSLPLDEVDEVLALPSGLIVVAEAHEAALGVVNLREQLLPIVSLRRLLGLDGEAGALAKVVVARIGDARVGLVVDRLTAILRPAVTAIDTAPAALNRGRGTALIDSICRLGDGGLVAILSAERLFSDDKTAQILADGSNEVATMAADDAATLERFVIFRLGAEEYGLPLDAVDEVVGMPDKLARVPNAPAFIEGVLNLRGKVTPIIDQRRRFAADPQGDNGFPRIVVTTVDDRQVGFIVDAVSEILPLRADQIEPTSSLTADAAQLFSRIATLDGGARLILLVEPKALLAQAERDLLAKLEAPATT